MTNLHIHIDADLFLLFLVVAVLIGSTLLLLDHSSEPIYVRKEEEKSDG